MQGQITLSLVCYTMKENWVQMKHNFVWHAVIVQTDEKLHLHQLIFISSFFILIPMTQILIWYPPKSYFIILLWNFKFLSMMAHWYLIITLETKII